MLLGDWPEWPESRPLTIWPDVRWHDTTEWLTQRNDGIQRLLCVSFDQRPVGHFRWLITARYYGVTAQKTALIDELIQLKAGWRLELALKLLHALHWIKFRRSECHNQLDPDVSLISFCTPNSLFHSLVWGDIKITKSAKTLLDPNISVNEGYKLKGYVKKIN